ncbi:MULTISPECIES: hypothetical protein [unclassified Sphingobium]|uniref:hypothetical protein n=1 Tax=unclassified Sphingobium TaxID=2611147 RepID=UPI002224263C|nr:MULTISPECIES: hypothetical protein [unclassified Sphingobium]MCW2382599.1 hypothetical protein [Sphingobium sp. B2D3B]MCW2397228.1 hypothetical protein [Sphingobium sp. B2D3C]
MNKTKLIGSAAIAALMLGSAAQADTRIGADLGVTGGVASNPYGTVGGDSAAATLAGSFAPTVTINSPTGTTQLRGSVTHTEYSRLYDGTTDYGLSGNISRQISPLTSLTAGLSYSSYVRNGLYPVYDPIVGGPVDPGSPIIVDPSGSVNYRQRSDVFSGQLGLGFTLSPRDTLNVSANGTRVRFPDNMGLSKEYDTYGGGLTYMRAIGANTSVGVGFNAARSDYLDPAFGKTTQYTPTAQLNTRLAPRLSLKLAAGLTFSETQFPAVSINNTSFYASADLCREGDRTNFCLTGSHGVSPSSIAGSSRVTAIGALYNYKIDQLSSFNASASYSRSSSLVGTGGNDSDYARASVGYERLLRPRLSAVISVTYSDTYSSLVSRNANIHGLVGLRYRLGQN